MFSLKQNGLTMIEVALAVMIGTLVMIAVWLQLQDMIKFYLSRNTAYTINARFDNVINDIKKECSNTKCNDEKLALIENTNASSTPYGKLNVLIKNDKNNDKNFDIWISYDVSGSVLQHIDKRSVRNSTAFYYVARCGSTAQGKEDKSCGSDEYYYSPLMPRFWEKNDADFGSFNFQNELVFYYKLLI